VQNPGRPATGGSVAKNPQLVLAQRVSRVYRKVGGRRRG
jgi:hypothetical protein